MPLRPHRRTPNRRTDSETLECVHFGTCGGCSLLDQPIRWQLADKVAVCERKLATALGDRLGGVAIAHTAPDHTPRWFRTRLLYPVRAGKKGRPITGLYAYRTNDIVRIEECQTADRWLTELGRAAEGLMRELGLQAFEPRKGTGHVIAFQARLASGTGEVLAGLVTRPGPFEAGRAFADGLLAAARSLPRGRQPRELVGVVHGITEREDGFLLADRHVPLRGRDHVVDRRDGLEFRISAGSFYQIHAGASALLYREALALLGDVTGQRVVDGYGGVGAFGLRLLRAGAASVTIVEDNAAACRDAEHNARANGLDATVVRAPFATAGFEVEPDLLVVDPPRSGLGDTGVARVLTARPRRLLHVACDVDALARDLDALTANGYRVRALRLCDLFPHTEHIELAALLERDPGAARD
ncbi:MAG: class I SAM-dependent RNA methyltransferase [Planctomycetes bacterium]|nr:class I SAM-dependent RNA methyltransferase [Planctomycetota bacterium]